ncbi:hypothetical protein Tco_0093068 [Tanacetum coccineum]
MKTKNPPLDQTGGPREEKLEKNLRQLDHHRRILPSQLASLKKGPNLIKSLLASLLKQRNQYTLTKTWKNPYIRSLTQDLLKINLLMRPLSIQHDWFQKPTKPPTPDRNWNKTLPAKHGPVQPWISTLAQNEDPHESFNELMDTPLDFSAFVLNRLKVDTLTPELLAGLTFELMKVLCKIDRESAHDVYSRNRIIGIKKLTIVEWYNYKHLEWIIVRRDDDKLYTFKEGDYNRLRLQDIKDMLLFLVQGKLTNLNIEERLALGVLLRIFTRSIVILRRVEDLQIGIKSYQKKLNLTKPDTYRSDLKRKTPYTTYSKPKGFIYQNKDKKNRLMRIDELHKFSDGTLNDV